eukprot:g2735.t1
MKQKHAIVTSANNTLCGTRLAYLAKGTSPNSSKYSSVSQHPIGKNFELSSSWGGMSAGKNMLYPVQTVDGLIERYATPGLREHCEKMNVNINFGSSVITPSFGILKERYHYIIHAVAPYFDKLSSDKKEAHDDDEKMMTQD